MISYRPGELACALDGEIREVQRVSGNLSNWEKFPLVFGNEAKAERAWHGTITHMSIESAFTSARDAAARYATGL